MADPARLRAYLEDHYGQPSPAALSSWERVETARIKAEFNDQLSFHGAIDIQQTLPHGTPEEVQAEVQERCAVLGHGGGYICTSAHYIQADTPLESVIALYTARRELDPA